MADGFYSAVGAASRAAMGLPPKPDAPPVTVTWTHAVTGIVVLAILQAAIIVWSLSSMPLEALRVSVDFGTVAIVTLAAPFVVLGAAAVLLKREQLPAIYLFMALVLAISQIALLALGAFGVGSAGPALVGLVGYFSARATKSLLGVGWGSAIPIGAAVALAMFAAQSLILVLPTGQAILAAA